jgi:serine/threonine protein kinase
MLTLSGWLRVHPHSHSHTQLTMGRTGGLPLTFFGNLQELDAKQLKMNLTVPKTKMIGEGAAQVADVASVQLPAFLLLDYTTDVRPEARLSSSGSAGAIFRAVLLSAEAIERNGSEVVALKEMVEWPSLSDEDNKARFMQELSMMWALSFHPNIAKVVGYTETPLATLTKLYPTDLFRYLHMQDDKEQLESHLLLHLCSGIVAGLAAVHSLKIAHRDMNSPNVLLGEPKAGNVFPEPVLADFGIARATEDNSRFESVNGYSPRYAAPEVIARIQVKVTVAERHRDREREMGARHAARQALSPFHRVADARCGGQSAGSSLEDDMESDLYALGVVLWETLSRRVRWAHQCPWARKGVR